MASYTEAKSVGILTGSGTVSYDAAGIAHPAVKRKAAGPQSVFSCKSQGRIWITSSRRLPSIYIPVSISLPAKCVINKIVI